MEELLNTEFLHPLVHQYRKRLRLLVVFLTKEFNCTTIDDVYSEAAKNDDSLDIVFVSVDGLYNDLSSQWPVGNLLSIEMGHLFGLLLDYDGRFVDGFESPFGTLPHRGVESNITDSRLLSTLS
jgi:hypothetical protein